jgi:hypothetical protein
MTVYHLLFSLALHLSLAPPSMSVDKAIDDETIFVIHSANDSLAEWQFRQFQKLRSLTSGNEADFMAIGIGENKDKKRAEFLAIDKAKNELSKQIESRVQAYQELYNENFSQDIEITSSVRMRRDKCIYKAYYEYQDRHYVAAIVSKNKKDYFRENRRYFPLESRHLDSAFQHKVDQIFNALPEKH